MDRVQAKITIPIRRVGTDALSEPAQVQLFWGEGHVKWLVHRPQPHLTLLLDALLGSQSRGAHFSEPKKLRTVQSTTNPTKFPPGNFRITGSRRSAEPQPRRPTQDSGSAIVFIQDSLLSSLLSWQGNFDQAEHIASQDAYRSRPQM